MSNVFEIEKELRCYRFKTELHCHSNPASPCSEFTPEDVVRTYKELGYDALVLTNHMKPELMAEGESNEDYVKRYVRDYERACTEAEKAGIRVIYGMEIKFPTDPNDYLVYGVDEKESYSLFSYLLTDLETLRREYINDGMILVQAHPCRGWCTLARADHLDGVEVVNMHPYHNSSMAFAARFSHDVGGIVTSGSDFHHEGTAGLGGIYTKELPEDTHTLAKILRSGDYLLDFGGFPMLPLTMKR